MDVFEIIKTTWRRTHQTLAIEYRAEYGSQPQVVILNVQDIFKLWIESAEQSEQADGACPNCGVKRGYHKTGCKMWLWEETPRR